MLKNKFDIVQHLTVVTQDPNLYNENVKNITSIVEGVYQKHLNEKLNCHFYHARKYKCQKYDTVNWKINMY